MLIKNYIRFQHKHKWNLMRLVSTNIFKNPMILKLKIFIACTAWLLAMIVWPADVCMVMIAGVFYFD